MKRAIVRVFWVAMSDPPVEIEPPPLAPPLKGEGYGSAEFSVPLPLEGRG